ncbi:hypothetical protein J7355_01665 [Endozoicomonas sp. G2_2]|nr:hypothetical protein [Endozoicomonas sp. G2_2]MBO9468797.1 hypothetical protein [Endozoicomonas sp. G2_2]
MSGLQQKYVSNTAFCIKIMLYRSIGDFVRARRAQAGRQREMPFQFY